MQLPKIIQGGMGVAISNWRLARAVAEMGHLGVVSGTAIDTVHARILQDGDEGGLLRNVYKTFPFPDVVQRVLDRWFSPGGKEEGAPYKNIPLASDKPNKALFDLTILSSYAEVALARASNIKARIGINLLDKVRMPQLPSLYGAMLAGVDYVLMGAGIPRHVPGVLDRFADGLSATVKYEVAGEADSELTFDPACIADGFARKLARPKFLAIISSATLALSLAKKSSGRVDGFVVETSIAGGHNAPPRGLLQLDASGQPVYGPRDEPELGKIAALGLPFWMAGGFATPEGLASATASGAAGIQVGTPFAFCNESGMIASLKSSIIIRAREKLARVFTDPRASPTGFPFKIVEAEGTLSDEALYGQRERVCDIGLLRTAHRKPDGGIGFRCAAESIAAYVAKGGALAETCKRMCLCNGLLASAGLGQNRGGLVETMVATAGDSLADIVRYIKEGADSYSARDVIEAILGPLAPECGAA
ncbi:nitronate monooxygenase [Ereboglobus luteus]|uniref:2-nitropropane dioxygenase n=1 Tax=Ereboglobus luteus TaxID=1796921 RepID=A0A2U8E5N1_9BACT|nr:nitronate monooxygenase [Ereboglobus luteus]AWI09864.1 2-nitropropane dioxygenase [Ereboglobus luteus]